jgi:hypothetical protein
MDEAKKLQLMRNIELSLEEDHQRLSRSEDGAGDDLRPGWL